MHRNSTPYRPKANGAVEAADKNLKKILRKMVQGSQQWHEKLPFALLGYRTTVQTSIGATPYLLVYGTEAVIPAEIEIPSLRVAVEAEIDEDQWVKTRLEQLSFIDEKRLASVCHGQLYQKRMTRTYNKKVRRRHFEVGQLVLRHILPHQIEDKGKFSPNWHGPFMVKKVLPNGALYLTDVEGKMEGMPVNADAVKRYYGNDPCGSPAWPHVFSSSDRVAQIQVQSLGLKGPLPDSLNELDKLENLGLQDILGRWNYPTNLTSEWSGNDPCIGSWLEFSFNFKGEVTIRNLQNKNLTEHKDPFDQDNIVNITVLEDPMMYTAQSDPQRLTNNFEPDNELGRGNFGVVYKGLIEDGIQIAVKRRESTIINSKALEEFPAKIVVLYKNRKELEDSIITVLEDPKMYIANSRNLVISTQYLWRVTNNFVTENGLGHGGFGVVYKDVTEDESQIIVKRIESFIINHKTLDKFQVELDMISKVLQCHLVSLLGYSVEGNERLLVYEFMSKGALSRHLFRWKILNLELLSQKRKSILL
ncbi:hypothetical protein CQW23_15166 [Capsicum baccatum]|uniref:Protein kinase domain-containing protein n=1 Tax=Capsicum baccatum TaxID=33114 RepID=A0A2G2WLA2_CAPBA|nr:hypothetical protein CQW23_15166 [Capsicum baccatum]